MHCAQTSVIVFVVVNHAYVLTKYGVTLRLYNIAYMENNKQNYICTFFLCFPGNYIE